MDFFAYSFLRTNEYGDITHWETHANSGYNDFLDAAIREGVPISPSPDPGALPQIAGQLCTSNRNRFIELWTVSFFEKFCAIA